MTWRLLAVRGIDALDGYFARYLPQLLLAVIVPLTVLVAVVSADWISAVIMAVTLPLIPVFMALVGMGHRARTDRQLRALQLLVRALPRRRQRADDAEDLRPVEGADPHHP